jgi:hypothetical protein
MGVTSKSACDNPGGRLVWPVGRDFGRVEVCSPIGDVGAVMLAFSTEYPSTVFSGESTSLACPRCPGRRHWVLGVKT